jgi:Domain of unknown function (DUF4157)
MSDSQRLSRAARAKQDRSAAAPSHDASTAEPASPGPAPQWAASHVPAPFSLGGVQRKVTIGPSGDAYEREADRVAGEISSGRSVAPSAISPMGSLPAGGAGQRAAAAPEEKKKDEKAKLPVQKADKPEDRKKDDKPKAPIQKAEDKKKEEKPTPPPVQKADKPEEKKKDDKPKPAVQKADKPDEKKKEEKPKPPGVQKVDKPEEKTKDEKSKAAPVQKVDKPQDKKKAETPKPGPVQKAEKPEAKQKEDKPKTPVQRAGGSAPQASGTPKEKDREKEKDKTIDQKLASAPVQKAAAPAAETDKEKGGGKEKKPEERPKPVQKADASDGVTERETERELPEESAAVQRAVAAAGSTPSMESAAEHAVQSRGVGEPIQADTRNALESHMGVDLGGVRVHQDRTAHETSNQLQARAFTHGNDIWLACGESQSNLPLMAHEAAHVVQQAGGVHRMMVQRADKKGKGEDKPAGKVDVAAKTVEIDELLIPEIKGKFPPTAPHVFKKPEKRENQRQVWRNALSAEVTEEALEKKLGPLPGVVKGDKGGVEAKPEAKNKTYFLQLLKGEGHAAYLIGTAAELKDEFVIPRWGPSGIPRPLDVDHKTELQLGGHPTKMDNLWLLDASANRSSGAKIAHQISKSIASAVAPEVEEKGGKAKGAKPKGADAKDEKPKTWKVTPTLEDLIDQKYTVTAKTISPTLGVAGEKDVFWEAEDIKGIDKALKPLKPLTVKEAISRDLVGDKNQLVIYPLPTGGKPRKIKWNPMESSQDFTDPGFLKGFRPHKLNYNIGGGGGSVEGTLFPNQKKKKFVLEPQPLKTLTLVDLGGLPYTTTIAKSDLGQAMKFATLKGLSPVEFSEVGILEDGIGAKGKLRPSLPIFKDLELDIAITGEDVTLSKTFTKDDFKLPGPVKVTAASLTLSVGTSELAVSGDVFFEVERLGKGQIAGKVGTAGGIELSGDFDFDSKLFDPARIHVGYADGKFSGFGEIGIKEGKVRGIKSASIKAGFEGEKITATGTIKPSIPGIEQGDLSMSYSPAEGLVIAGALTLKKDIPGIEGGSVSAQVTKKPGSDDYIVKASGEATPKIPGVSSKLMVSYDDGAFDAVVTAGYEKGLLKGSITVGATNRPVGEDNKPAGPPPEKSDKVTIYGSGSVALRIAPWLQATAAIKLLPNGEIEVTGEIGLPASLPIFPEKKLDKNIFKVGIDIPIVGVAVLGQRIGIFANITGGLDLSAGIGPAELNQLKLSVTFNPAHEEDTKITGDANLHIPAHAGLRLFVRGSVGLGIPIVSVSAGLTIGGSLGLEGALDAGVHVEWTPTKGLDLTAQASIYVEPKLKFDITGDVLVEADLWIKTIELYSKKWELASFEYGSGLKFGLKFPIHYQEGHPFDISLSDVEFEVPKIEPGELLEGLIKKIA